MADEVVFVESTAFEVVEVAAESEVLETGFAGPPGATGPQGPQGAPGLSGASYVHSQGVAALLWTVAHNLNRYPSVMVVDSAGTVVEGEVRYTSPNEIELEFGASFAGFAYLN